jgi:hypothetical protein
LGRSALASVDLVWVRGENAWALSGKRLPRRSLGRCAGIFILLWTLSKKLLRIARWFIPEESGIC